MSNIKELKMKARAMSNIKELKMKALELLGDELCDSMANHAPWTDQWVDLAKKFIAVYGEFKKYDLTASKK